MKIGGLYRIKPDWKLVRKVASFDIVTEHLDFFTMAGPFTPKKLGKVEKGDNLVFLGEKILFQFDDLMIGRISFLCNGKIGFFHLDPDEMDSVFEEII